MNSITVKSGMVVDGRYKRAGGKASLMALEVSAVVESPSNRGTAAYLFGVRTDEANSGKVVAVRSDAFDPRNVVVSDAPESFEALGISDWYTTSGSQSFAFVEELTEEDDQEWSKLQGGMALSDLAIVEAVVYTV